MTFEAAKNDFYARLKKSSHIISAATMLNWDMETIMPPKSAKARAEVMGTLYTESFKLVTDPVYGEALQTMKQNENKLDSKEKRMLSLALFEYERSKKIPADLYAQYSVDSSYSKHAWKEAKQTNDFSMFEPHLQKMIDYSREFAELWGYDEKPYDALLEDYDPDLKTKQLDPVFNELLAGTRRLLENVADMPVSPEVYVPIEQQSRLSAYLLEEICFDLDAGLLATTEHPFTSTIHAGDVRLTTHYYENNPSPSIFSVLHEGGHGLYEQGINPDYKYTPIARAASMGMHESQSRFWENIIGRSFGFWDTRFNKVNEICETRLAESPREFWKQINKVKPSLIRIEADELTYNLHIIIRYELEKAIFNDNARVKDLPALWNEKYHEYLGLTPPTDSAGVLQDVHWSGALFGYFPSYTIGNLYAAQFAAAMEKKLGSIDSLVRQADGLAKIRQWQLENIHSAGSLETPAQLIERVCGEKLSAKHFLNYIEKKINELAEYV